VFVKIKVSSVDVDYKLQSSELKLVIVEKTSQAFKNSILSGAYMMLFL